MNEDGLLYAPMEPMRSETVQCGGDVRFMDGKLQQRYVITEYCGGSVCGMKQEWRDVPMLSSTPTHSNGMRSDG